MDTYPGIFLDRIQTFSSNNFCKWLGYWLGVGGLDTHENLNVTHAS